MTASKPILLLALLLAASTPLRAQEAHISCRQIAAFPESAQALYVRGMMDGIGLSFTISDATAMVLEGGAATDREKTTIEQMRRLPQDYFDPGPSTSRADVLTAVMARCKAEPDLSVDSAFMDVVAKN